MSGTIHIVYDDGHLHSQVQIAGEFTGWQSVPLGLARGTRYAAVFDGANAGQSYMYKFIIDGHWSLHPAYGTVTDHSGFVNHSTVATAASTGSASQPQSPNRQGAAFGSQPQSPNRQFESTGDSPYRQGTQQSTFQDVTGSPSARSGLDSGIGAGIGSGVGSGIGSGSNFGTDFGTDSKYGTDSKLGDTSFGKLGDSKYGDSSFGQIGDSKLGDSSFGQIGDSKLGDSSLGQIGDSKLGNSSFGPIDSKLGDSSFGQIGGSSFGQLGDSSRGQIGDSSRSRVPGTEAAYAQERALEREFQQPLQTVPGTGLSVGDAVHGSTQPAALDGVPGAGSAGSAFGQSGVPGTQVAAAQEKALSGQFQRERQSQYGQYDGQYEQRGQTVPGTALNVGDAAHGPQGSYGQGSYGQGSYGQGSYGQDSYGQTSYGQGSYGQGSYGTSSYGTPSYGQSQHDPAAAVGLSGATGRVSGGPEPYEYTGSQLEKPRETVPGLDRVPEFDSKPQQQPYEYTGSQLEKPLERVPGLDKLEGSVPSQQPQSHPYEYTSRQLEKPVERVPGLEKLGAEPQLTSLQREPYEYTSPQLEKPTERVPGLDKLATESTRGVSKPSESKPEPYEYTSSQLPKPTERVEGLDKFAAGQDPNENAAMPGSLPFEKRYTGNVGAGTAPGVGSTAADGYVDKKVGEFGLDEGNSGYNTPYDRSFANSMEDQNYESATENFDDSELLAAAVSGAALGQRTGAFPPNASAFPPSESDRTISKNFEHATSSELDAEAARRAVNATVGGGNDEYEFEDDDREFSDALAEAGGLGTGSTKAAAYTSPDGSWTAATYSHTEGDGLTRTQYIDEYVEYEEPVREATSATSRSASASTSPSVQRSPYGSVRSAKKPHQTIDVSTGFPVDEQYEGTSPTQSTRGQRHMMGGVPTLRQQSSVKRRSHQQTGVPGTSITPGYPPSTENRNAAVIAAASKASAFAKQDVAAISNPQQYQQSPVRSETTPRKRPVSTPAHGLAHSPGVRGTAVQGSPLQSSPTQFQSSTVGPTQRGGLQGTGGLQGSGLSSSGVQGSGLQSSGLSSSGLQSSGVQSSGLSSSGLQGSGLSSSGLSSGLPSSGVQSSGLSSSGLQGGLQGSSAGGLQGADGLQGSSLGGTSGLTRSNTTGGLSSTLQQPSGALNGLPADGRNDLSALRETSSFDRERPSVAQVQRAQSRNEGKFKRFFRKLSSK